MTLHRFMKLATGSSSQSCVPPGGSLTTWCKIKY